MNTHEMIVVYVDKKGLIANGRKLGCAARSYFLRKREQKGYHITVVFCKYTKENIIMYLDSGTPIL